MKPIWYTIPEFANSKPKNMYHKELEKVEIEEDLIKNLHVLTRTNVVVDCDEETYLLRITADDSYKLYINGIFVTVGPIYGYVEQYYYKELDLTPYLKKGTNVIALHTYYQGEINRVQNSGDGRYAVAAMIKTSKDSEWKDITWKYQIATAYSGETIAYKTQYLENFDSRLWDENWNQLSYDDSLWEEMVEATWADYHLEEQPVKSITTYEVPLNIVKKEDGRWLIDLGQEITGNFMAEATGDDGSTITIRCGEELNDDGSVRYRMRCFCDYEEIWTLAAGKTCKMEQYDYKGFRYVEVFLDKGVQSLDLKVIARHYPMDDAACTLVTDYEKLNQVFSICKNAVKYGTQEGYLDCPTREKGQYLGDAVVTANSQAWLSGNTEMMKKCLLQMAQSRNICPGLMAVAPGNIMQEIADFSLLWSQILLQYYRFTGDLEFLKEMYPVATGILEYFKQYEREDGLLVKVDKKWNLVDWPEGLRDGYDFKLVKGLTSTVPHNVVNSLYIGAMKTLSEIESLIGVEKTYDWETVKDTYFSVFYREEQRLLADSEISDHCALHSNLFPLYFGLFPTDMEQEIADFVVQKGLCCGVYTSYFVLKALAQVGRYEDVYGLIVNESEHGWVNMVREGATCCYEAWGKDQKWNTSLCHPWASSPITVLIECIAGFVPDPSKPEGYTIESHIPESISEFEMKIPFRGNTYVVKK